MTKNWWPDSFRWRACYAPEKLGEPVPCQRCGQKGKEIVDGKHVFCPECYELLREFSPFVADFRERGLN